jgi:hypothetical protein
MTQEIDANLLAERAIAMLATVFGLLATLLASIGLRDTRLFNGAANSRNRNPYGAGRTEHNGCGAHSARSAVAGRRRNCGDDSSGSTGHSGRAKPALRCVGSRSGGIRGRRTDNLHCGCVGGFHTSAACGDYRSRASIAYRVDGIAIVFPSSREQKSMFRPPAAPM